MIRAVAGEGIGGWSPGLGRDCVVLHLEGPRLRVQGGSMLTPTTLHAREVLIADKKEGAWSLSLAGDDAGDDAGPARLFVISSSMSTPSDLTSAWLPRSSPGA